VTVSGNHASRVFQVNANVTASISGLTITGGTVTGNGGGVYNKGTVTLTNVTLSGNSASASGGGLSSISTATLLDCTVSGNTAVIEGGGIVGYGGTMTLNIDAYDASDTLLASGTQSVSIAAGRSTDAGVVLGGGAPSDMGTDGGGGPILTPWGLFSVIA